DALSLSAMRITGIRLGGAVEIAAADVAFDFTRLPALPVERLSLDGLRLDLTAPERPMAAPDAGEGSAMTLGDALGSAAGLPGVSIHDLTIVVPAAGRTLTLVGNIEGSAADTAYAGRFAFRVADAATGEAQALSLNGTARVAPDTADIDAALAGSDGA